MPLFLRRLGLGLLVLLSVFLIAFGALYATVEKMLFFHAAAVPESLRAQFLPLYLALMKLIGGSSMALGGVCLYLTLGAVRRGAPFALTVASVAIALPIVTAAYVAETLAATTGAPTSWHLMGILLAILLAALVAFHFGSKVRAAGPAQS